MAQKNKARRKAGQKHLYTDDYLQSAYLVKDSRHDRRQKRTWKRGRK